MDKQVFWRIRYYNPNQKSTVRWCNVDHNFNTVDEAASYIKAQGYQFYSLYRYTVG